MTIKLCPPCSCVSLIQVVRQMLGVDPDCSTCRAGAYTGRPARQVLAHITFNRDFCLVPGIGRRIARRFAQPKELPEQGATAAGFFVSHLDNIIRTIALTVATAYAIVLDVNLAIGCTSDGIGRAVLHAMRVLAMAA